MDTGPAVDGFRPLTHHTSSISSRQTLRHSNSPTHVVGHRHVKRCWAACVHARKVNWACLRLTYRSANDVHRVLVINAEGDPLFTADNILVYVSVVEGGDTNKHSAATLLKYGRHAYMQSW